MTAESSGTVAQAAPEDITDTRQRAVIYCRVSTDDKGQTNETQERECRRWCESMDFNVVDIYTDQATGTNLNRPGFALMQNRIMYEKDIDIVVAYDQSRITRSDNIEQIRRTFMGCRCRIMFVADSASNSDDVGSRIVRNIKSVMNEEENNIRCFKTALGMQTRIREGKHVGRPARFMFIEDLEDAPEGRFREGTTVVYSYTALLDLARQGVSLRTAARRYLGVSYTPLMYEMMVRDPDDPECRAKGKVDRYTPYLQLYNEAISTREGMDSGRVEKRADFDSEKVVE